MLQFLLLPGILRLFLASAVVVDHATRFTLGVWAVWVFFCLSGYWITVMYRRKYSKYTQPMVAFYLSRYLRLLPVYIVCQVLMLLTLVLLRTPIVIHGAAGAVWWLRTMAIISSSTQVVYLGPSWSLDMEAQFYLLFPFILYLLLTLPEQSTWRAAYIAAAVFLLYNLYCSATGHFEIGGGHFIGYFLGLFLLGVANALKPWRVSKSIGLTSAFLFLGSIAALFLVHSLRGYMVGGAHPLDPRKFEYHGLVSTLLALVFYPYVCYSLTLRSTPLDKHLGNMAYPIYLFHWIPEELFGGNKLHTHFHRTELAVIQVVIVIAGSLAIYFLVDQPCENFREAYIDRLFRKGANTGVTSNDASPAPEPRVVN